MGANGYECAGCGADTPSQCLCGMSAARAAKYADAGIPIGQLRDELLYDRIERITEGVRTFDTGATRDADDGKYDYEGFLDPAVLEQFAAYMHSHRVQSDGQLRDSDNWQKGIPTDQYMKSLLRHVMDLWLIHRGHEVHRPEDGHPVDLADALGGILFNVQGYWHNLLKETDGNDN